VRILNSPLLPDLIIQYQADHASLDRLYSAPYSRARFARFRRLYEESQETVNSVPLDGLSDAAKADLFLFKNHLQGELLRLGREERQVAEMGPLLPFAADLLELEDARRRLEDIDSPSIAKRLNAAVEQIAAVRNGLEEASEEDLPRPFIANRAAIALGRIAAALRGWHGFYSGYDPVFTWWTEKPFEALTTAMDEYAEFLRKEIAGAEDEGAIIGDPIGREGLMEELALALVPYTPEELIAVADREKEWCLAELRRAAQEMGCGDDTAAALERVKADHVAPGEQPKLVRDLAREAVAFLRERDLVTIPPLAEECWRMEMMPPEMQKVNPFFLGGEEIIVSFPTDDMDHSQKEMSLRGNNRHFARATVQHELIPGHHLQMYSQDRHRPYRKLFYTPFWTEGWTLHWEMLLWDLGFPRTPEERIGMLFWRLHRCARVVFSLRYHLGEMTPQECVEMLVTEVGHERANAEAEVRRSFGGDYDALYQAAYLLGGLQVRALHREMVGGGKMSQREFHDRFLHENCMPIGVLHAVMNNEEVTEATVSGWRPLD
jgi:hypothetical protein